MNYYGKNQKELSKDEQTLLSKDMLLIQSFMMKMDGQQLIGMNPEHSIHLGTQKDVDERTVDRELFAGVKLLGLKQPKTQKSFDKMSQKVADSPYGFYQFVEDYMKNWSPKKRLLVSVVVME
jgi:hypothetical protein